MFCVIKTIFAYIILLIVGQTLVGAVLRGFFWSSPPIEASTDRVEKILTREVRRLSVANIAMTLLYFVLSVALFYTLYHFWNVGLAGSAGLLLVSRLPDQLWKIRTGDKIPKEIRAQAASMPKGLCPHFTIVNIKLGQKKDVVEFKLGGCCKEFSEEVKVMLESITNGLLFRVLP